MPRTFPVRLLQSWKGESLPWLPPFSFIDLRKEQLVKWLRLIGEN
jgi:hypothetical protein